jgi:hypothetical protein
VDEHLMCEIEGHHLTSAAIVGHDGATWAQSTAFPEVTAATVTFDSIPTSIAYTLLSAWSIRPDPAS